MSLPQHFLQSIQHVKGLDIAAFEQTHANNQPITSIRIHPAKAEKNNQLLQNFGASITKVPWCNHGFYLPQRPSFTLDPLFHAGAYYVQEASSMFLQQIIQQIFTQNTACKVLDVCAAPGGKSTLLASYFTNGLVVSNEVIKTRAAILTENCIKWGTGNMVVTNNDPKDFSALQEFFNLLVVDAPCSGSGMFRKDETAVEEWSLDNVALCSQRQKRILADVLPSLQENGVLIYSTCSYSQEENEDMIDWMMEELDVETIQIKLDENWGVVETQSDKKNGFGYRFYPNKLKGEGFFIAALRKRSGEGELRLKTKPITQPNKQELQVVENHVKKEDFDFFKHENEIRTIGINWLNELKILANYVRIRKAGTGLGEIKGKDFVPSHELAVSIVSLANFATISFNREHALLYLKRRDFAVDEAKKGWVLATYQNIGLGWLKILPNRINNYYPQEWRILKD